MKPRSTLNTLWRSNASGFTLMEVLVSLGIIGVLAGAAIIMMPGFTKQARADGTIAQALNSLRLARDRAIGERRNFEVRFLSTNHIQVARQEIPGPATTVVSDIYLENGQQFLRFSTLADTPDAFGGSTAIAFGVTPTQMFTSEGSFVDSVGDVLNGTVFFGAAGDKNTARAITVFGPTALIRVWRWNGSKWTE
jgi:prepilin-type N-terminal cleavage/methylation domain-containing protein